MTQSQIYLQCISPHGMGYGYNSKLHPQCLMLKLSQSNTTFIINIVREEYICPF